MIDLSEASLFALAAHRVGHKLRDEDMLLSQELVNPDEILNGVLEDYFLKPFKSEYFWHFTHISDLALNEIYTYTKKIFDSGLKRQELLEQSGYILQHLYEQSNHPNIKSGELYVAYFTGCHLDEGTFDAIGIFKSEDKDLFLVPEEEKEGLNIKQVRGINIKKLDKGALIFKTFDNEGYSVLLVDRASEEAQYWRDDFLQIQRIEDDAYQTEGVVEMVENFCEHVYGQEAKDQQLEFMNRSLNYLSKAETYDVEDFKVSVLGGLDGEQQIFDQFQEKHNEERELKGDEEFRISRQAVSEARRKFKSRIKLDTGVELHIHPQRAETEYIERGFDNQLQMGYYKVFFRTEE